MGGWKTVEVRGHRNECMRSPMNRKTGQRKEKAVEEEESSAAGER